MFTNRSTNWERCSYHFHYINEDDFTYLCLADSLLPKATAFAFLEEMKRLFCEKYVEN